MLPALLKTFRGCLPRGSSRLHLALGMLGVVFWVAYLYCNFCPNRVGWLMPFVVIGGGVIQARQSERSRPPFCKLRSATPRRR